MIWFDSLVSDISLVLLYVFRINYVADQTFGLRLKWESHGDLHSHKVNANVVSILRRTKLLAYTQNRIANCLSLDECMIWTLDFSKTVA